MLRKFAILASFVLVNLCLASTVVGEEIPQHDQSFYARHTQSHAYTNDAGESMPYRLFMPRDYDPAKKYPLLLSLHGAGSRGDDNLTQLRPWVAGWMTEEVQRKHPCIILMPQCHRGQQWVNTPWGKGSYDSENISPSVAMELAKAIFDKIVKEKSIDRDRIYVMGASMGGYGTWGFIMDNPELVAAAVPICGAGDPSRAATIKHIPIWAFHGDIDNVVPPSGSTDMIEAIRRAGGTAAKSTMYEGVRHGSYTMAWREQELIDWLFAQRRCGGEN